MLTIIDRYIARNFFVFFLAGIAVFLTIFLAVEFMSTIARYEVASDVIIRYFKNYIPMIIYQLMPVGILIGTLFTLSTMNKNNELVALFSLGWSLARISAPILACIGFLTVSTFWLGDRLVPTFAKKKAYIYYVDIRKKPGLYSTVREDKIWYRSDNTIFNIQLLNSEKAKAQGITLYYFDDDWNLVQLIKAKDVFMHDRTWNLENGSVTLFAEEASFPLTKYFKSKTLNISEDLADIKSTSPSSETLSYGALKSFIEKNKAAGLDTLRYEVDMHAKISYAFAGLILALVGIPFTVEKARSGGNMASIGIALAIAFAYWILYSSSLSLGKAGILPPLIAAWMANILVGGTAGYLLVRLKR